MYCLLSLLFHSHFCVSDCILCHPAEQYHNMSRPLEFSYKGARKRILVFMSISTFCLDLEALKLTQATLKKIYQTQCRIGNLSKDFLYGSSE